MYSKRLTRKHAVMKSQTTVDKESLKSFQKERKITTTELLNMLKHINTLNTQAF